MKQHPEIYFVRSDKGNVTVAMSRQDYVDKSLELLNDTNTYKLLKNNPTTTLQTKANKIVKRLVDEGSIDEVTGKKLKIYNAVAPRFYALPKIHKPTLSMRPITSAINAPNAPLAAFITKILTQAYDTDNAFFVKDSFTFSSFINDFQLPDNYIIVSFDVVSLFTNLPLEVVVESLEGRWNIISQYCSMTWDSFKTALQFIFDSNYVCFNNQFFKQIFGTPMGSTISPILVNFVLDDLVSYALDILPFHVPFVKRYVDDLLLAVPKNRAEVALFVFNSYNQHLQFTVEHESDNSIPFLDMKVIRNEENILKTCWYRKPMSSDRYISYHSYHPLKMKINLITALKTRALRLSHRDFQRESLKKLQLILYENSYPPHIVNKFLYNTPLPLFSQTPAPSRLTITHLPTQDDSQQPIPNDLPSQTLINQPTPTQIANTDTNRIRYFSLPFIEGLTSRLTNVFGDIDGIKIAKKQTKTVSRLYTKTKTPLPPLERYNVVYRMSCNNCDLKYIGQTSRNLKGRIISHKSDCKREVKSCALSEHTTDTKHKPNYDEVEILASENNFYKRTFLEMVHIHNEMNAMNKKTDIQNLSNIYSYVLKLHKHGISTSNS